MKVYSISRWAFYGICILILALPVGRHWKLLTGGKKATGLVVAYNRVFKENLNGDVTVEYASEIQFQAEDSTYKAYGPLNYEYKTGRKVKILYDRADPSDHCILTFSGFYLRNYSVIPMILLVVWAAFYLSFNSYLKRAVFCIMVLGASCKYDQGANSTEEPALLVSMKEPIMETLQILDSALYTLQTVQMDDSDFGALWCPRCHLYHTRAAEALYPFAYQYTVEGDTLFRNASIVLGNWLIEQQESDGSWKETPEEWTGTSTDQLLMMALTYPLLIEDLSDQESKRWLNAMRKAGNYLVEVMAPEFASINYVATTAASMAVLNQVLPDPLFARKAESMAQCVVAKMDDDHFITGEGGRVFGIKYGVDLAYNLEMSLWGLALYARTTEDQFVFDRVKRSLERHLHFIYPDGSMDGSWGIRSNKWTGYGGATSDGCQVLFSLLSDEDPAYRTAALANLDFLGKCMKGGFVGYGPHHWEILPYSPCIYPTFAKAKNLAMAHAFCVQDKGPVADLPGNQMGLDVFPTLDIATVRTENFYATVTNYGYKDPRGTFTNLYEFDAASSYQEWDDSVAIRIFGELKDRDQQEGGIGYSYHYIFKDRSVGKRVRLRFHDRIGKVDIIEPIIMNPGTRVMQEDSHTVTIAADGVHVQMSLRGGNATLSSGNKKEKYWSVYPALQGFPLTFSFSPEKGRTEAEIYYEFRVLPVKE